jgi:hypothetical protein
LPRGRSGQFNEALMGDGLHAARPDCARCPCARRAEARTTARYPRRDQAARPLLRWKALALRRKDGAVLLQRGPPGPCSAPGSPRAAGGIYGFGGYRADSRTAVRRFHQVRARERRGAEGLGYFVPGAQTCARPA